jgi:hypothetical protein
MTAAYNNQLEQERLMMKQLAEDSIAKITKDLIASKQHQAALIVRNRGKVAELREHLDTLQSRLLDSVEAGHEALEASHAADMERMASVVRLRTRERDDAESALGRERQARQVVERALREARKPNNTGWKIAAGAATVLAIVAAVK